MKKKWSENKVKWKKSEVKKILILILIWPLGESRALNGSGGSGENKVKMKWSEKKVKWKQKWSEKKVKWKKSEVKKFLILILI